MNKATPTVYIEALSRFDVSGPEASPVTADEFVNFSTSHIDGTGGGPLDPARAIRNAEIPLWNRYERGRFKFNLVGDATDAIVGVFGQTPDGEVYALGEVALSEGGTFEPFEFDIEAGMNYAVRLLSVETAGSVDLRVSAQAYNTYLNLG